ncbi:MAG: AAA family ATPase [Candidatus Gastranaerophilales bacterium]
MYLKKIKISNFRRFSETGIEAIFNKGVNAIIGENNIGKSALLDAIRIAFSTLSYQKQIYFLKSDFHVDFEGIRANTAQFDVYLGNVPRNLIELWDAETVDEGEFHVKFYISKSPQGIEKIKYAIWGGKIEGNTISSETLESVEVAFLGALRNVETEMKPSRNSKLANLLETISDTKEKRDELVKELKNANATLIKKSDIIKAKNTINDNLSKIEQATLSQQIDIGLVEPRFESVLSSLRSWIKSKWIFISQSNSLYSKITHIIDSKKLNELSKDGTNGIFLQLGLFGEKITSLEDVNDSFKEQIALLDNRNFELFQNGLGYNNLVFMSTILGDMSMDKKEIYQNLLLVEEPEAHLHPQLQELIHNYFETEHMTSENIQVIYTSHSPTLVSKINMDKINLLYEKDFEVKCLSLSDTSVDDMDKIYLQKYLDVTKSQIFFSKGIIFVEGISEALLLPEIAKYLDRPLDKYAVEVVNVDSLAFKPFVNLLTDKKSGKETFAKSVIITDDDRCTDKSDVNTYISKDIDYDCADLSGIINKLNSGTLSNRCLNIKSNCKEKEIQVELAFKTLEYELAYTENNIAIMLNIINEIFPTSGPKLKTKIDSLTSLQEKQTCIWLFIRHRDKYKGEIALKLSAKLNQQKESSTNGEAETCTFDVPKYIKKSISFVTSQLD